MIVRVLKTHVFKDNIPFRIIQIYGIRLVKDLNICIYNLEEPLNPGHSSLKLFGKLNNAANRGNQCGYIEHVSYQISGKNQPFHHKNPSRHHHHQIHKPVKHLHGCLEHSHIFIRFFLNIKKLLIIFLKLFFLNPFIGKCFYHFMSQKAILYSGV